ncbi:polysaccharide biosynthesis tyrosine autokinase [Verrucomicrobium sp. BvORR106]|uniref:polysaccharide biosynthesis tyrosine autokinase n=1 Tax=Verrucomicrobium sp. BvORR106 TaxID=1403819 RepID=UPI000570EBC2|nr:polysaccharide biosynthesis tyrosine autokinase [Verrucomicrobium sp. BvORR106]
MESYDNLQNPASSLNRFHETSAKFQRYKILLRRRWWFLLLTAAIALCVQTLRITGKPVEFRTIGRIHAGTMVNANASQNSSTLVNFNLAEFYGTQIEILNGPELRKRALLVVRTTHAELAEIDVDIRVVQTKGSSILNVIATGKEREYVKVFATALLDQYIAFRKEMIEDSSTTVMNRIVEQVLQSEKKVKEAQSDLETFLKDNDVVIFEGDRNQSALYLAQLKQSLNVYETELKLMEKMGLDNYLKNKDRQGTAPGGAPAAATSAPASGDGGVAKLEIPTGTELFTGLSRSEQEYLKALADYNLLLKERDQLLKTFRPEHPVVKEVDTKLQTQSSLIGIHKDASVEEWQRRIDGIKTKIDNLNDQVKIWENKAREANAKIVTHQSLKTRLELVKEDKEKWDQALARVNSNTSLTTDLVAIMERPADAQKVQLELVIPLLVALAIGLAAGSIILLLFDRLDDRMNSFSEFQALFPSEPIVGQVPEQRSRGDVTLIRPNDDRHLYAEAFRNLRSSILFKNWKDGRPPKLILVTSAVPNEGKTTTVSNLAITMALGGSRVLLVDGDLRRGGVNELFKLPVAPGFSNVLTAGVHWRDAVLESGTKGLHVLPRGEVFDQTSELFLSRLTEEVLKEMGDEYDYVIFDSAPVLVADDTASFAPKLDTVLFVVRLSSTMARLSAKAMDLLYDRQVNVGGVILNRSASNLKEYTYYNYASYYSVGGSKGQTKSNA